MVPSWLYSVETFVHLQVSSPVPSFLHIPAFRHSIMAHSNMSALFWCLGGIVLNARAHYCFYYWVSLLLSGQRAVGWRTRPLTRSPRCQSPHFTTKILRARWRRCVDHQLRAAPLHGSLASSTIDLVDDARSRGGTHFTLAYSQVPLAWLPAESYGCLLPC